MRLVILQVAISTNTFDQQLLLQMYTVELLLVGSFTFQEFLEYNEFYCRHEKIIIQFISKLIILAVISYLITYWCQNLQRIKNDRNTLQLCKECYIA